MRLGRFRSAEDRRGYVEAYELAMAQLPRPTRTADIPTSFGTVRTVEWSSDYEESSGVDGPPVMLLPGRASGIPMWQENLPDLLPLRTVIAVDALGDAGLSKQTRPLTSMDDQASWIAQLLSALGIDRVHLVGHSFGGATAAAFAVRFPTRTASVALLEPVFTLAYPPLSTFGWTTVAALPVPQSWRDRALAAIGGVAVADVRSRTPLSDMIAAAAHGFRAALPTPRLLTDTQVADWTVPTYVAIADHSSLAGGPRAVRRGRQLSTAHVEVWPHTTHSLPMQVHTEIAQTLGQFWGAVDQQFSGGAKT